MTSNCFLSKGYWSKLVYPKLGDLANSDCGVRILDNSNAALSRIEENPPELRQRFRLIEMALKRLSTLQPVIKLWRLWQGRQSIKGHAALVDLPETTSY